MLTIKVPLSEEWDDDKELFVVTASFTLELEHSLATMSKWEQSFEKPFLGDGEKTREETLAYIEMMMLTPEIPPEVLAKLRGEHFEQINKYIHAKMTATWFREERQTPSRETITAEIIYHWMIHYNVWLEAENWHLNKLLTLLRVCNEKAKPPKKMNRQQQMAERQALNARRKAERGTTG